MTCQQCEEAFAAALDGCLDADASRRFDAHLAICPACRSAFEETRRIVMRLAGGKAAPVATESSMADAVADRIIREQALRLRRIEVIHRRITRVSAAAAVLLVAIVGLSATFLTRLTGRAYGDDVKSASRALETAGTATWRTSYYMRFLDPDGQRSKWVRIKNNTQRYYFKSPGLYRREDLDESGNVRFVAIEDIVNRASLELNLADKVATLRSLSEPSYSPSGPFATFLEAMKQENLQSLGHKQIEGRAADGYRFKFYTEGFSQNWSYEFWIDSKSKQLVRGQVPGGDIFELSDVLRDRLCEPSSQSVEVGGATLRFATGLGFRNISNLVHEVSLNPPLDDALFSLQPPAGYTPRFQELTPVSEKDVLDFLGVTARYFDGTFPSRVLEFGHGSEYQRFERVEADVLAHRGGTEAEVAFVEAIHKWKREGLPGPGPLHVFVTREVEPGSWKYLGDGVKLGDKDRIVCWYRLNGSEDYRVVDGSLGVREVAEKDLPLPAGR